MKRKHNHIILFALLVLCLLPLCGVAQVRLSLDSCLSLAEQNNLQLRNAQLDIERAEQVQRQAFTKYFPQVSAYGFAYYAFEPVVQIGAEDVINAIDDKNVRQDFSDFYQQYAGTLGLETLFSIFHYGYSFGASAVQPIFMGGQIVAGNKLAKVGVEAATLQSDISRRDLLLDVENTYWLLVGLQAKEQTLAAISTMLDTIAADVEVAMQAGLATQTDRLQVRLRQSEQQNRLLQLANGITLARQALCQTIGLPLTTDLQPTDTLGSQSENSQIVNCQIVNSQIVNSQIVNCPIVNSQNTPSLEEQLLSLQVRAEQLRLHMEVGKALPQLAVGATYGYHDLTLNHPTANGMVFATLQVPLTAWWETGHKIREQKIAIEQAKNTQLHLTEQLQLRRLQLYQQIEEATQQLLIAQTNLQDARENLRLNELNYRAGLTTLTSLMQAQATFEQALSQQTDARIQQRIAIRRYEQQFTR